MLIRETPDALRTALTDTLTCGYGEVSTLTDFESSAFDTVRSLLSVTPFDTVVTVLERHARKHPQSAPVFLAAAAWCEIVRDDTVRARGLSAQALEAVRAPAASVAGSSMVAPDLEQQASVVEALADIVNALSGDRPFDDEALTRIAEESVVGSEDSDRRLLLQLACVLEIPNWFTYADRYDDAARLLDGELAEMAPKLETFERVSVWCCLAELEFRRGRWDIARQSSLAAIEAAREMGDDAGYAHALAARIEAGRAHRASCDGHVRAAWSLSLKRGDRSIRWRVIGAEAFAAASLGEWPRVRGLLEPLAQRRTMVGVRLASVRLWDGDYLEALVRLEDRSEAHRRLEVLRSENAAVPTMWTTGTIARISALLARSPDAGLDEAEASVDTFEEIGAVFEAARSQLILGELLLAAGLKSDAVTILRSAALTFGSLGATTWLDRVDSVLSEDRSDPTGSPIPDSFSILTAQELEVALAVVHGATNKEAASALFVSVKTIETHMTRLLRKLGLRSRAELVAAYYVGIRGK